MPLSHKCTFLPGHVKEHTCGPCRPPTSADGPDRIRDIGREAQRKEAGS